MLLDVIRNKVKLAQKAFDKSTDKVGIIMVRKILKQKHKGIII